MSEDDRDFSQANSQAPEDILWAHFSRCWRGECSLLITFLTGTGALVAVELLFFWLEQSAAASRWSEDVRFVISALGLNARVLVWGWFGVGLLRASLRYHRLGRRFWPIVAVIYGALFLIGAAWVVITVGPKITAAAISRVTGTYP